MDVLQLTGRYSKNRVPEPRETTLKRTNLYRIIANGIRFVPSLYGHYLYEPSAFTYG